MPCKSCQFNVDSHVNVDNEDFMHVVLASGNKQIHNFLSHIFLQHPLRLPTSHLNHIRTILFRSFLPYSENHTSFSMGVDQEQFLAICFQNLESPPVIDFDGVAAAAGMSKGGAQ